MKTKTSFANSCSRRFSQCAFLAVAIVAASTLAFARPVFAQADVGSDPGDPLPWGSTIVANPPDPFHMPGNDTAESSNSAPVAPAPMQPVQPESSVASVPTVPDANTFDAENPPPWGSTVVNNQDSYGDFNPNTLGEPGGYTTPSYEGSVMAPGPEGPALPETSPAFVPQAPVGLVESFGHPPINPTFPELPPAALSRPGTFNNFR